MVELEDKDVEMIIMLKPLEANRDPMRREIEGTKK